MQLTHVVAGLALALSTSVSAVELNPPLTVEEATDWLWRYHNSSHRLDADAFYDEFNTGADYEFQYGNNPVVSGEDAREGFRASFAQLDALTHYIQHVDVIEDIIYQSAIVVNLVKGDDPATQNISIRGLGRFTMIRDEPESGSLRNRRSDIYCDPSELVKRINEVFPPEEGSQ